MIEIKLFKEANLKGYTFIEGFPGAGLVGPMTISYIVDKLQMKYIGYLESDKFPPLVSIHKNEAMPPIRIYCSDKEKIITIFAEFAITVDVVGELSNAIYDFIRGNGITTIFSIGGMPATNANDKKPYAITSNDATAKKVGGAGLNGIEEGVATGVNALLLVKSTLDNMDDINIMVPIQPNIIDPMYAEIAIQSLNKLMNLNIDVTELDKEAKMVEAKIKDIINKHKEMHDNYKRTVEESGPSMYA